MSYVATQGSKGMYVDHRPKFDTFFLAKNVSLQESFASWSENLGELGDSATSELTIYTYLMNNGKHW